MKLLTQKSLSSEEKQTALKMWNTEYPVKMKIPGLLEFDSFFKKFIDIKHYLLIDDTGNIIGWAATFSTGPARSFFIMLSGGYHGKGYGTTLLNEIKKEGSSLFAWAIDHNNDVKADGKPYLSPIDFYLKNGFIVNNELRMENEQISAVNILWKRK